MFTSQILNCRVSRTALETFNFYAAFSPIVTQDSRVGQDTQHGYHLTRLSLERTAFLTLTEWRLHQHHLPPREPSLPLRFAAPLLHQSAPLDKCPSQRMLSTELKHCMRMPSERSSHSTIQRARLGGILVSATDGLISKKSQLGHYHGFPPLKER